MKISSSQMFRNFNKWCLSAVTLLFLAGAFQSQAQDGGALFKKCATCHNPFKDGTGPKLKGVKAKWDEAGEADLLYEWVKNSGELIASGKSKMAKAVESYSGTAMPAQAVSNEEIDAIFDWIDAQEEAGPTEGEAVATGAVEEEETSLGWIWIVIGVIFIVIILSVGGVRRQLKAAESEANGGDFDGSMSYRDELKQWAWLNRKYVGLGGLVVVISVIVTLFLGLYSIGVVEDYQPSQPIQFPHSVHAGTNGIDCKYCHNSVTKSKTAGLPTVNVCMNCHKQIEGNTPEQQAEIAKIYAAAGYDAAGRKYTGETQEIVWNKVHVLPDHVYFSHKQHVVVGGVDCAQCHGDMTQMTETAKVQPVAELNKVDGNIQLTKATLTMGWCIECHQEKEIAPGPLYDEGGNEYYNEIHRRLMSGDKKLYSEYLEDNKVTVAELGGWECAKCHY